jgi:hypothetical protein
MSNNKGSVAGLTTFAEVLVRGLLGQKTLIFAMGRMDEKIA